MLWKAAVMYPIGKHDHAYKQIWKQRMISQSDKYIIICLPTFYS